MTSYSVDHNVLLTTGAIKSLIVDFDEGVMHHIDNSGYRIQNDILIVTSLPKYDGRTLTTIKKVDTITYDDTGKKLWLDVTGNCNLNCKGCYAAEFMANAKKAIIDISLVEKVRPLSEYFSELEILGGEPFVHNNLGKIIKELAPFFQKTRIHTNGTITKKEILATCKSLDAEIKLSVYGLNSDEYLEYTGKRDSFEKVENFIQECKNIGVNISALYLVRNDFSDAKQKLVRSFFETRKIKYRFDFERFSGASKNIKIGSAWFDKFFKNPGKNKYVRNLFYHSCITGSIGIDVDGYLFSCPMERSKNFGEYKSARQAIDKMSIEWNESLANKYEDCRVCEFQGICFDCNQIDQKRSKHPTNCPYNPITGMIRSGFDDNAPRTEETTPYHL